MTLHPRWRRSPALALLIVFGVLTGTGAVGTPAPAAPSAPAPPPDSEGGTPLLRDVLESTGRGYVEAKRSYDASRKRQLGLTLDLQQAEAQVRALKPQVGQVASAAYRTGRLTPAVALLNSASPDDLLERAEGLDMMTLRDNSRIRSLNEAVAQATAAKSAMDREVAEADRQLLTMRKQRAAAERALAEVGGHSTGGFVSATSPVARPAPRARDGSWPGESCSRPDPTTSGCVTPRTLHSLNEAKRAGFGWFVSCYRPAGPYEHPKGRACDFSSQRTGFGGDATGAGRTYGNNLAAFLVRNADRLGVLYVIWYRQIWLPATGWKSYGGAYGDPSSDHTNHVHLSLL